MDQCYPVVFSEGVMDLVKQQLIVSAAASNGVGMCAYDTVTWSYLNQWKSNSSVSRGTLTVLHKWRSILG